MFKFRQTNHAAKRGSVFIATLLMLLIASIGIVLCARTIIDHGQMFERKRDTSRAFYAAEAGINQVVHWFNNPDDFIEDPTLFVFNKQTINYDNIMALLESGPLVFDESLLPVMHDSDEELIGLCESLSLEPPDSSDPLPCIGKIVSVGVGRKGVRRRVVLSVNPYGVALDGIDAPLISLDVASFAGEAEVHWGETWAKGDLTISSKKKYDDILNGRGCGNLDDDWWAIRTEGRLLFENVWNDPKWNTPSTWYLPDVNLPVMAAGGQVAADFGERMRQNEADLEFPVLDYAEYKELALRHGRYYSTDAAGNLYRDGIEDAEHLVLDYAAEFNVDAATGIPAVIFIDTIDGEPPAADGSNLANLSISGGSPHTKGVYFMCVNLDITGMGNPPTMNVKMPDGNYTNITKVFHDGILYAAGTINSLGNNRIYGSIITGGGFIGAGTPDIFYNVDLKDGMYFPIVSKVKLVLWKNY